MFQDDRMMSILSGVVLMVAIGTVVQKSDALKAWFAAAEAEAALVADEAAVEAANLAFIDVLANDRALDDDAAARLVVTTRPACGQVFIQNGAIQYLAAEACSGTQTFAYGLRGSALAPAEVRVAVGGQAPRPQAASVEGPAAPRTSAVPEAAMTLAAGPGSAPPPAPREAADRDHRDDAAISAISAGGAGAGSVAKDAPAPLTRAAEPEARAGAGAPPPEAPAQAVPPRAPAERSGAEVADVPAATAPAGDARPAASAPEALPTPAAVESATATLPEALTPRREVSGLAAAGATADGGAHGIEAPAPASPVAEAARPGTYMAEAGADMAEGRGVPPEAPRPADAAAPAAPGVPAFEESTLTAAAPAPVPRPRADGPTLAAAPRPAGYAPAAPVRRDSDPLANDALADADPARATPPAALAAAAPDEDLALAAAEGPPSAGGAAQPTPQALDEAPTLSFSLAQLAVPEPSVEPSAGAGPTGQLSPDGARVERAEPPRMGSGEEGRVALSEPEAGLGPVRALGQPLTLMPVERAEPPALDRPKVPAAESVDEAAAAAPTPEEAAAQEPAGTHEEEAEIAALTPADAACVVPPEARVMAGRAAITTVRVLSPCHAGQAAVLEMGGIGFGLTLGADGEGRVDVPGFQSSAEATVRFADGETLSLTLPFEEIGRVERVALVWDMAVALELHALEFGAGSGSEAHVRPDNPRSFRDVRRSGGGFLQEYAPAGGMGQHVRVYTYYLRAGGPSGIVRMTVDFASRRAGEAGTCGDGALASPGFTVLRTSRGMEERPSRSRLAALSCGSDAETADEMIDNAVGNLVIAG